MRCRQGDLAIYIGPTEEAQGKVTRCVEYKPFNGQDAWRVDPRLAEDRGFFCGDWSYDKNLIPLRDSDADDETLSWADVPKKENVT